MEKKGTLIKYIASHMLMTLIIRLENGEEITLSLDDDPMLWICGDYTSINCVPGDVKYDDIPDMVTCEIGYDPVTQRSVVIRTIVEKDGIETVEE